MRLCEARREIVTEMMKDTIFEAAGSVLERHGLAGITMSRVAQTAGLATASLYNYFQGKDDLLKFIFARLLEPFLQAIEEIANSDLSAPQKLEGILHMALEHSAKHKCIIRLLAETNQEHEIKKKTRPCLLRLFSSIFAQGIKEGSFRPHNPIHTGHIFLGCLSELFESQADGASDEEVNDYVGVLVEAVLNGFSIHAEETPRFGEAGRSP